MLQVSGLLCRMQQLVFWPGHFLTTGRKPAVCSVAISLMESWRTENAFSIRTKPSPTATAGCPWGCVSAFSCLQRTVENKMLIFVLRIFIVGSKPLHWMLGPSRFGAVVRCGLLGSCYVFRVWGGANNLLLTFSGTVTPEENEILLLREGKQRWAVIIF